MTQQPVLSSKGTGSKTSCCQYAVPAYPAANMPYQLLLLLNTLLCLICRSCCCYLVS